MQEAHTRVVAAFDFDGTLTRGDTLLPFLRYLCGRSAVTRTMLRHAIPLGTALLLDLHARRAAIKEQVLGELLTGRHRDDVGAAAELFGRRLARDEPGLRPQARERWHWHRAQGHEIVVVSASLEAYILPFARELGGAHVLATHLVTDTRGVLTGAFDGFNCRGAEKVRRLREWGLRADTELWAYGDSSGDSDLLAAAHVPHRVGRGGPIRTPPDLASERR